MNYAYILKIIIVSALVSLPAFGTEEERPTGSIFAAIGHYEQGDYKQAANIFKRYAGKPVPVAEPFCLDLVKQGFLTPFQPIPRHEESGEDRKACLYFDAAQKFPSLKNKNAKYLDNVAKTENGPLLYLIGTLYEIGTKTLKADPKKAEQCYLNALKYRDFRAVFGLKRVALDANFMKGKLEGINFSVIHSAFDNMSKFNRDEGQTYAQLYILSGKKRNALLFAAAQFGDMDAQFEWAQSHCANEPQNLYWLTHCAASNHFDALNLCGNWLENGKGTKINYKIAYDYHNRAAHHPKAEPFAFSNLGLLHEQGKGTDVNYQVAAYWYGKAYEAEPTNQQYIQYYGRTLALSGEFKKALPFLQQSQHLNDDARFNYAMALYKNTPEAGDEVTDIWLELAEKGHLKAIGHLILLVDEDKINLSEDHLRTFKKHLENAIQQKQKKIKIDDLTDVYLSLRNLRNIKESLFAKEGVRASHYSKEALQISPDSLVVKDAYAYDLKNDGRYEEALHLFLEIQKLGYPVRRNAIGACYDAQSKKIQTSNPSQSVALGEMALACFRDQLKEESNSVHKTNAAFNIHCLACQNRIKPLTDEEHRHVLQIAVAGGDEDAKNDLAMAYRFGWWGFDKDEKRAEHLLREAMSRGLRQAKINLMNLLFSQGSSDSKHEGNQLLSELWEEDPEGFSPFLENFISSIKKAVKAAEDETSETDDSPFQDIQLDQNIDAKDVVPSSLVEEKKCGIIPYQPFEIEYTPSKTIGEHLEEKEKTVRDEYERLQARFKEMRSKENINPRETLELLESCMKFGASATEGISWMQDVLELPEEENKSATLLIESPKLLKAEMIASQAQGIQPTKKEKAALEEKERLQRKFERLTARVENLSTKKQAKYRKIQTLMNQHIQAYGGGIKNASGSGRRLKVGSVKSGFHKPHKGDIKAGALGSLTDVMEKSSTKNNTNF